jgi:hypothetical protein
MIQNASPQRFRLPLLAGLCVLLAACGGSGAGTVSAPVITSPTIPTPNNPSTPSLPRTGAGGTMRAAALDLIGTYAPSTPVDYTPLASVPRSGSAVYRGYVYGDISDGTTVSDSLIGNLTMTASFSNSSAGISGNVANLVDNKNRPLSGTLSLSNGSLDRAGDPNLDSTLSATLAGTVTNASSQTVAISARLEGDFFGPTYKAAGGAVIGSATIAGTERDFDGGFVAAR